MKKFVDYWRICIIIKAHRRFMPYEKDIRCFGHVIITEYRFVFKWKRRFFG